MFTIVYYVYYSIQCIGAGNGNSLLYSCLENAMDRGAWWGHEVEPWGHRESGMTEATYMCVSRVRYHSQFQASSRGVRTCSPQKRGDYYMPKTVLKIYSLENSRCLGNRLEKEMATHSSVLAWRIPGTREPGGLPSVGLHRVRHDWSDLAVAVAGNRYWIKGWISICIKSTERIH